MRNTKHLSDAAGELTSMSVTRTTLARVQEARRDWDVKNDAVLAAWEAGFSMLTAEQQMEARFAASRMRREREQDDEKRLAAKLRLLLASIEGRDSQLVNG